MSFTCSFGPTRNPDLPLPHQQHIQRPVLRNNISAAECMRRERLAHPQSAMTFPIEYVMPNLAPFALPPMSANVDCDRKHTVSTPARRDHRTEKELHTKRTTYTKAEQIPEAEARREAREPLLARERRTRLGERLGGGRDRRRRLVAADDHFDLLHVCKDLVGERARRSVGRSWASERERRSWSGALASSGGVVASSSKNDSHCTVGAR